MIGKCMSCKKQVNGVKSRFSWGWFFLGFGVIYCFYRLFKRKNRCPVCGLKILKQETKANDKKN